MNCYAIRVGSTCGPLKSGRFSLHMKGLVVELAIFKLVTRKDILLIWFETKNAQVFHWKKSFFCGLNPALFLLI